MSNLNTDNPTNTLSLDWLNLFADDTDVWKLDTGGVYAGPASDLLPQDEEDTETAATWQGTVAELRADLDQYDWTY